MTYISNFLYKLSFNFLTKETNNNNVPSLLKDIKFEITNFVDLSTMHNLRLVDKEWKAIVDEPCFHLNKMNLIVSKMRLIVQNIAQNDRRDLFLSFLRSDIEDSSPYNHKIYYYEIKIEKFSESVNFQINFETHDALNYTTKKIQSIFFKVKVCKDIPALASVRNFDCYLNIVFSLEIPRNFDRNYFNENFKDYMKVCLLVEQFINEKFLLYPIKVKVDSSSKIIKILN